MFVLLYNHLKVKVAMFSLSQKEPFKSTEGLHPLQWSPLCSTQCFYRWPNMGYSMADSCGFF